MQIPDRKTKEMILRFDDGPIEYHKLVYLINPYNLKDIFHIDLYRLSDEGMITREELKLYFQATRFLIIDIIIREWNIYQILIISIK